ncbi:hypothetical protein ACFPZ3_69480 [Nonomuraea insulae]|uniref:Uncharacterized protein n=1 Tax=Nonomuraea insulae TaxID=1616787 RepID=A0ABW1DG82_9ACTN
MMLTIQVIPNWSTSADPGYEGEVGPFNPREWLEVHPAPAQ